MMALRRYMHRVTSVLYCIYFVPISSKNFDKQTKHKSQFLTKGTVYIISISGIIFIWVHFNLNPLIS